jgi:hypothetical protein
VFGIQPITPTIPLIKLENVRRNSVEAAAALMKGRAQTGLVLAMALKAPAYCLREEEALKHPRREKQGYVIVTND